MFLCDDVDRLGARIFRALRSDCPCCTFWRGVALGVVVTTATFVVLTSIASAAALVAGVLRHALWH